MGSSQLLFQFLSPARIASLSTQTNHLILTRTNSGCCCCTNNRSGERGGGSRWYPNPGKTERFNFNHDDEFLSSDYEAFDFISGTENTKRKWWSGDSFLNDDEDEVEDEDEDEDDFGVLEGTIGGISWITKVQPTYPLPN